MKNPNISGNVLATLFMMALLSMVSFACQAAVAAAPALDLSTDIPLVAGVALACLELFVRIVPTSKDRSLVTVLFKVLNAVLPANRAKNDSGSVGIFEIFSRKKVKNPLKS